jgi:4-hydroxy-2-oxoheptanedioate aldolase
MSTNMLKKRLQAGKACVNAWLAIPSGFSAETMAQCGWDSVTVDMQHGVQDYHSMVACFQAMDKHPVTPLVRVPWNEPGIIGKVLDGGAWGVICPMVNNAAEAKALVSYSLYPPKGKRSNGPIRAGAYGAATPYQATANDEVLIIPMIETQEAISACRSAWCLDSTARSRRSSRSTRSSSRPSRSATCSPASTTERRATLPGRSAWASSS